AAGRSRAVRHQHHYRQPRFLSHDLTQALTSEGLSGVNSSGPAMTLITPIIQRGIDEGGRDPDAVGAQAAEDLKWFRRWDRVFEWDPPTFRWFVGGQTNLGFNAVDRHVIDGNGGRGGSLFITHPPA